MLQFLIDLESLVHPGLYDSILLFFSKELIDMYMDNKINTDDFRAIRYMIKQAKIK